MDGLLTRNWGWVALRGVVALIFGLLTLRNPALTLAALVFLFGAYSLVDGISAVLSVITNRRGERSWIALMIGGLAGIIIGVYTFLAPGVTATVLLYFIAAWAIVMGIAQIVAAIRLREVIQGEWLLGFGGALSVALGLFLISRPAVGALAVVIWIGAYAVVMGLVLIGLAFRLRAWGREHGADAMARPV